jgi:hypothetical protein
MFGHGFQHNFFLTLLKLLNPMVFFVDHMALKYLVNKPNFNGRLARWILLLEQFDYTMEYKLS